MDKMSTVKLVGFLLAVAATYPLQVAAGRGWIVSGPNKTTSGVPSCSYCVNVLSTETNFTGATVSIWRCASFYWNEANWEYDATTSAIQIFDKFNNRTLCLDAGVQDRYDGQVGAIAPFRVQFCNASRPEQQWFLSEDRNSGTIRSGLTLPPNGQALYMVRGELPEDARFDTGQGFGYFSIYLSTQAGSTSGPSSVTLQFTFQPIANYVSGLTLRESSTPEGDYGEGNGNLVRNGGFENCTLLPADARRNCSVERASVGCTSQARTGNLYENGELFSLCGWGASRGSASVPAPMWVSTDFVNGTADGKSNSSILLVKGASINQTIPTRPDSQYALSFSLAGYLSRTSLPSDYNVFSFCDIGDPQVQVKVEYSCDDETSVSALFYVREPSRQASDAKWSTETGTFKACSSGNETEIIISADGPRNAADEHDCGLVIDNVVVVLTNFTTRSPGISSPGSSSSLKLVVGSVVASATVLLIVLGAVALFFYRCRYGTVLHLSPEAQGRVKVYSIREIRRATMNLSPDNLLGEGGFSTVYKARFPNGVMGAVKVQKTGTNSKASATSLFAEEVALLQQVRHRYLVNLIGICTQQGTRMLIFDYLPNGSLADKLHSTPDTATGEPLTWLSRMKIAYQVACALEYLHHGTSPPIVHRDVKSANILLTISNAAKLADFGLSKAAPPDATQFLSVQTSVKGSFGYLDPQYVRSGVFSSKSDVYSYGVVLLELITGHPAIKNGDLLSKWAQPYLHGSNRNRVHELVDHRLREWNSADLLLLVELVEMCLQDDAQARPTMKEVVLFLTERDFSGVARAAAPAPKDVSDGSFFDEQEDVSFTASFNVENSRSAGGSSASC